jgi:hypothetical protein
MRNVVASGRASDAIGLNPSRTKEARMRGDTIGRLTLLFMASVVVVAFLSVSAWSQAPFDPQSLIGEWNGSWKNTKAQGVAGPYHLKIDRVQGDKVYGQVEISYRDTVKFRLVGTLDGNRLTFNPENPTELLIEGNQMRGTAQGSVRANPMGIALTKAK